MTIVCPTVTATNAHEYRAQMEQIEPFAERVHIDLMDGIFAPTKSPSLDQVWWPENITADIHLMYKQPMDQLEQLVKMKPHLVVMHYEAEGNHAHMATHLRENGIKAGLAILGNTAAEKTFDLLPCFDHVLIFGGHLGYQGGQADLANLDKVKILRQQKPDLEISWDGGINDQNARQLVEAGVNVLNTGGFIQQADDPSAAYGKLIGVIQGP